MKTIMILIFLGLVEPNFNLENTPIKRISFQLIRNFIIVEASVDGKEGLFIVDTGVSDIILNNRYFTGKLTGDKFYGISGIETEKEIQFIRFNIGGLEKKVRATVTNFNALEKFSGLELFGVVGNGIFHNCEVVLDYVFKELTIYELDKNGNRFSSNPIHHKPLDTLSFSFSRGVPSIEIKANGQQLNMIVDSGATANVLDITEFDRMNSNSFQVMDGSLTGFGPSAVFAKFQTIDKWKVGDLTCPPMKTISINLDHLNQSHKGSRVNGILGYEFLSNFRVSINFRKKEIYLWDRETMEYQWELANKF